MEMFTTHQAKTQLSQLIRRAQAGEDIVVCRGDQPAVRLVPVSSLEPVAGRPKVGTLTSDPISYTDDAFSPLCEKDLEDWGL